MADPHPEPLDDVIGRLEADIAETEGPIRADGTGLYTNVLVGRKDIRRLLAELAAARKALEEVEPDARRYRYLREHCSYHSPMTHEQPAEWSIGWEFQQVLPDQAFGTFDKWIDRDIEWQTRRDAEDEDALAQLSTMSTEKDAG